MNYYKKLNPSKKLVEMLYRVIPVKYNDNTTGEKLEYLSSFGIWQGSMTSPSSSWMENLNPITEIEFKSLIGELNRIEEAARPGYALIYAIDESYTIK